MIQAKVYAPELSAFSPPAFIDGSWQEEFPVLYHGPEVPGGKQVDSVTTTFLDTDGGLVMDNKIRDAVRAKGLTMFGVAVGRVISFAAPRAL